MGIADALFSQTQQRVLGLMFGQPDRQYGTVELIKLAESGSGAVQRELARLVESGLITVSRIGSLKRYQANRAAPIFEELRSIIEKTSGAQHVVRAALAPFEDRISLAVMFGSVAKKTETAASDIDVLVVSDSIGLDELYEALLPVERQLGRRVSPTLYTREEFRKRRRSGHAFLANVFGGKHEVLLGSEDAVLTSR